MVYVVVAAAEEIPLSPYPSVVSSSLVSFPSLPYLFNFTRLFGRLGHQDTL